MDTTLLNWYQGLQLLALGPCLFIIFFLFITASNYKKIIVPILYFISLAANFLIPLHEAIGLSNMYRGLFLMAGSLTPVLSFLLIIQFITGRIPPLAYWSILAVPVIGGSEILYLNLIAKSEICVYENLCATPAKFRQLYEIFSSSLVFLLTITIYSRLEKLEKTETRTNHQYALIISLIMLNLAILFIKLLQANDNFAPERADIAITIVRIGFIYLVLTSVFRIFDRSLEINYTIIPLLHSSSNPARDLAIATEIKKLMEEDKLYRTVELNREMLARKLAVTENQLSRIINHSFAANFNLMVNSYRIQEAKEMLIGTEDGITEIAFAAGFNSIPSFNRVFKQITGLSPTEYRKSSKH